MEQALRLDRTAFAIQSHESASHQRAYWMTKTPQERLAAAWYLICTAYNLNYRQPVLMDRTHFEMRKQDNGEHKK